MTSQRGGRVCTALLVCAGMAIGCTPPRSSTTLGRSGEQTFGVEARSGTLVRARLRTDDQTRTADLAMDFETAWARLPGVLQEIGLSVGAIDDASGRLGHSGETLNRLDGKRLSNYLNCGMGTTAQPYANLYRVSLSYEVLIAHKEVGPGLHAEMRVEASARPRDVSGNPLRCTSKGTLERLVFRRLQTVG